MNFTTDYRKSGSRKHRSEFKCKENALRYEFYQTFSLRSGFHLPACGRLGAGSGSLRSHESESPSCRWGYGTIGWDAAAMLLTVQQRRH
jgi:hypothetical protein